MYQFFWNSRDPPVWEKPTNSFLCHWPFSGAHYCLLLTESHKNTRCPLHTKITHNIPSVQKRKSFICIKSLIPLYFYVIEKIKFICALSTIKCWVRKSFLSYILYTRILVISDTGFDRSYLFPHDPQTKTVLSQKEMNLSNRCCLFNTYDLKLKPMPTERPSFTQLW